MYSYLALGTRFDLQSQAWFDLNHSKILKKGEVCFHENGQYKMGDSITILASLPFIGGTVGSIGVNTQTSNYTLDLSDFGKLVEMNKSTANTLTIPLNSVVPFPLYTEILVSQLGTGQTTIIGTSGVALLSPGGKTKLFEQYSSVSLFQRAIDQWYLWGDITL